MSKNQPSPAQQKTIRNGETPEEEQLHASELKSIIDRLDRLHRERERRMYTHPVKNSELAADDTATHPIQLGHLAASYLNAASDHARALVKLLDDGNGGLIVPIHAAHSHLRAIIENASIVLWLLGPGEPVERRRRLLAARQDEISYERILINTINGDQRPDETKTDRSVRNAAVRESRKSEKRMKGFIAAVAKAEGLEEVDYSSGLPGWRDLIADAARYSRFQRASLPVSMWILTSGMTHPSSARALLITTLEEVKRYDGGEMDVQVAPKLGFLVPPFAVAAELFEDAMNAMRFRSGKVASR